MQEKWHIRMSEDLHYYFLFSSPLFLTFRTTQKEPQFLNISRFETLHDYSFFIFCQSVNSNLPPIEVRDE